MRLKFTRDAHLRLFNRLLGYNLPQELEMLKYVPAQTGHVCRPDVMQRIARAIKGLFTERKKVYNCATKKNSRWMLTRELSSQHPPQT